MSRTEQRREAEAEAIKRFDTEHMRSAFLAGVDYIRTRDANGDTAAERIVEARRMVRNDLTRAAEQLAAAQARLITLPFGRTDLARDWRRLAEDHLKDAIEEVSIVLTMLRREEEQSC